MPRAMNSSSPHSPKDWPIPSFGGKCEKLNQQWLKTQLLIHLKNKLIWTSTANNPTLRQRLLTIWPVLRRPKLKSFRSHFHQLKEVKRVVDERSGPPQQRPSVERPTSSWSQQSESNNHINDDQLRKWNQNQRNRTNNQCSTPNRGQSHNYKKWVGNLQQFWHQLRERMPTLPS